MGVINAELDVVKKIKTRNNNKRSLNKLYIWIKRELKNTKVVQLGDPFPAAKGKR